MITVVTTQSGSIYEIDRSHKCIRIVRRDDSPPSDATRAGNGEWREYDEIILGYGLVIVWPDSVPHAPGTIPGTITSRIVEIAQREPEASN